MPLLVTLVSLCGLDVVKASAVKVLILVYSLFVLFVFSDAGMVDWTAGGLLGWEGYSAVCWYSSRAPLA